MHVLDCSVGEREPGGVCGVFLVLCSKEAVSEREGRTPRALFFLQTCGFVPSFVKSDCCAVLCTCCRYVGCVFTCLQSFIREAEGEQNTVVFVVFFFFSQRCSLQD